MPTSPDGRLKYFQCRTSVRPEPQPSLLLHFRSFTVLPSVEMLDGFREQGSSFVPDGTRFVLARSPSDESLGYFRASLRDLGSRCILMRSNRLVVCEPFPVEPRMTRVSRTNAVSKVPSGRTTIAHGFNRGLRMQGRQETRRGERKRRTWRPTKISARGRGLPPARRAKSPLWPRCRAVAVGRRDGGHAASPSALPGARGIPQRPRDCAMRKRFKRRILLSGKSPA